MKNVFLAAVVLMVGVQNVAADDNSQGVATFSEVSGKVLVNSGKGFVPAVSAQVLNPGDRVFVGNSAFATLSYGTCDVLLAKPAVFTVTTTLPCDRPNVEPAHSSGATGSSRLPPAGGGLRGAGLPRHGLPLAAFGSLTIACAVKCSDVLGDDDTPVSAP